MPSLYKKESLPALENIINKHEKFLWIGKPKYIPFVLAGIWDGIPLLIFIVIHWVIVSSSDSENRTRYINVILPIMMIGTFFWGILKRILFYKYTNYAFTNQRILIQKGFRGRNMKSIDYDKIIDFEITANIIEQKYSSGSVKFFSGRTENTDNGTTKLYDYWEAIDAPYEVFQKVRQALLSTTESS